MASTGFAQFDTTIQKTNELLKDIEQNMGWENKRNQSYLALRVVLHSLRKYISSGEAEDIKAELPKDLRSMFGQFI